MHVLSRFDFALFIFYFFAVFFFVFQLCALWSCVFHFFSFNKLVHQPLGLLQVQPFERFFYNLFLTNLYLI